MREVNLGPVANADGTPTDTTIAMLAGTGRDPVEFARATVERDEDLLDATEEQEAEYDAFHGRQDPDLADLPDFTDSYEQVAD